jgi:hypothetical protein
MGFNEWYRERAQEDRAEVVDWLRSRSGLITLSVVFGSLLIYLVVSGIATVFR